ncbi:hypothetical protein [Candidatus Synchoanobacter obligatus]|uniref:Ribosome maturation factor RimP n=1 Tax=Candidatus Synchoanobacter obligatus TaxID=2919597 RepID=A0ABT1L648_9GAMM|nr:hypothetical protein [Candidatus Synchoanobacter obligatus]MCP8351928.1 hypothetical protein [Candidatus Synchoanobacter obligatus]
MNQINEIIKAAVTACDMKLYGIDNTHEGITVYIEKNDGVISISDCEIVMKQINYSTDTDHLHIEVSSKGAYPLLFTLEHFQEALGENVKVRTTNKSYSGTLALANQDQLHIQKNDETFIIDTPTVKRARLIPSNIGE